MTVAILWGKTLIVRDSCGAYLTRREGERRSRTLRSGRNLCARQFAEQAHFKKMLSPDTAVAKKCEFAMVQW
jgi:hypothetical protein